MILIGADPEVFLRDSKGSIIPSIGLLGGSKNAPRDIGIGSVQEDNVLAEFNIKPAKSKAEFVQSILSVMSEMGKLVDPLKIDIRASHTFDMNVLQKYGDAAFRFGCDPDMNAWLFDYNTPPDPHAVGGLRSAGGHIHIGMDMGDDEEKFMLAATMDIFLGIPSVLLDDDMERRKLYGKAGAFRLKPYGIEYRTLSNFWLKTPELIGWAYDNTIMAANTYKDIRLLIKNSGYSPEALCDIINKADKIAAKNVVDTLHIPLA